MLDLNDLRLFVQVVDSGGIASAAHALALSASSVSRRLVRLEQTLGLRLVERNAKNFAVTESGREIYRHCVELAAAARAAEDRVAQHAREPSGRVRLSSSIAFGQVVLPGILARFARRFPHVNLSVEVANRSADSVNAVCAVPMLPVATPDYLDRAGRPQSPSELPHHVLLAFGFADQPIVWELTRGSDIETIAVNPRAQLGDMVALQRFLLLHGGIAQLPDYLCRADLAAGRLERVLPDWNARDSVATLLLPARRGIAPGARALADFIAAELPLELAKVGIVDH